MLSKTLIHISLLAFFLAFPVVSSTSAADEERPSSEHSSDLESTPSKENSRKSAQHLFTAKLLLRRLETVDLTPEQLQSFNELSADLTARIWAKRETVGITKKTIERRDAVYSKLKETDLEGDAFWNTLQEEAGLTAAQRDVFRETLEHFKKFKADALGLLTDEQKARLPKGKFAK
ncbi:MAG: hypothetical protein AAF591_09375 [Verrucomicrobiota bacterium]